MLRRRHFKRVKGLRTLGFTRGCLRSKVRALKVSIDTLVQVEGEPLEV